MKTINDEPILVDTEGLVKRLESLQDDISEIMRTLSGWDKVLLYGDMPHARSNLTFAKTSLDEAHDHLSECIVKILEGK